MMTKERLAEIRADFVTGRQVVRDAYALAADPENDDTLEAERFQAAEQASNDFNAWAADRLGELLRGLQWLH